MRLLRIIHSLNPSGGGPVFGIREMTPYMSQYGIETTVASLDDPSSPWLYNLPFDTLPLGPSLGGYGYHPAIFHKLLAATASFDSVIIEGLWQYHSYVAYRICKLLALPYYIYPHGMLDPWFNQVSPLKHFKKLLYWKLFEQSVLNNASAVLFTTQLELSRSLTSFSFNNPRKLVVGYGAPPPLQPTQEDTHLYYCRFPQLLGKHVVLFLGRIHPKKGVDLLIQAFSRICHKYPSAHLVLAGPCSKGYRNHLNSLIQGFDINTAVTWTGSLHGTQKAVALATSQLFCLPSHQENFGVAVAEALSYGLPVAISNAVNISESVSASGSGLVFANTVSGTTECLHTWFQLSLSQHKLMSVSARRVFSQNYHWSVVTPVLAKILLPTST